MPIALQQQPCRYCCNILGGDHGKVAIAPNWQAHTVHSPNHLKLHQINNRKILLKQRKNRASG
jgi:hypothetical protein